MRPLQLLIAAWMIAAAATLAAAQGVQTGTIRGIVHDEQGLAMPGVTVTATSPALQEPRTAVTATDGSYAIAALPAGDYTVTFELQSFTTIKSTARVPVGSTVQQNVTLNAGLTEAVQVVAQTPAAIATPAVGSDFKHEEIESLATPRTLEGIAQLSPGLTENAPNTNQVIINGAFAFDNVFMVNGVDVNDNLFANPQSLFVEDAIQETQVLTAGISAEYGRFTGGVINAVTKSGGDTFSGSVRTNFLNPSWTVETPFEKAKGTSRPDQLQETYEGTLGGPLLRHRLWFFSSGRFAATNAPVTLNVSGVQESQKTTNKRGEIKLTGTLGKAQTIQGGYLNNNTTVTNASTIQSLIIDPHSLNPISEPNAYYYTNYHGVVGGSWLAQAQYSQRTFAFNGVGGTGTDLVKDSPIASATQCACIYNAPYFDATDPEQRNNRQLTASLTHDWSQAGRHETKGGYEFFRSQRTGGNSQSPTSYVFDADFATDASGNPVLDATGRPVPVFVPGVSYLDYFPAVRGAVLNVDESSAYVQDHWTLSQRWSADLGARFEHVLAQSTGAIVSVDANRIVPRLAVAYDVKGNGSQVAHVTFGQYSGRYNEVQIGANSPVGNPPDIEPIYRGPAGQGYDFAPGFNLANYPINSANAGVQDPTKNVFTDPNLKSPVVTEVTGSYGLNLFGQRGYAEASYVHRKTSDLIEDFQTIAGGFTNVTVNGISAGDFTNKIYKNTDLAHRAYDGMVFQARYQLSPAWNINGHYTLQLRNDGNYEGEGTNAPGSTSFIGNYPEAFEASRNFPDGRLQDFERSRLRLWSVYTLHSQRLGDASFSGLWRYDSGLAYSLVARNQPLTSQQIAVITAAGYPDFPSPGGNDVFFGPRGSQTFPGYGLIDTSINYNIPVFRTLRPWVKFDVFNLFNNQKLIAWNTTVSQDPSSPIDALGLATGYIKGPSFGTATGPTTTNLNNAGINAYPVPFNGTTGGRTFRVAAGLRF